MAAPTNQNLMLCSTGELLAAPAILPDFPWKLHLPPALSPAFVFLVSIMQQVSWPYLQPDFLLFYSEATIDKYHMSHSKKLFLCLHSSVLFILVH